MPYNINLMKKGRSEDEFKALEQEVQRLKEENLTLKDTVAILKQQCLQERLAKDQCLKSFIKLQKSTSEAQKNAKQVESTAGPSNSSAAHNPSIGDDNPPKTLAKTRSRQLLELKLGYDSPVPDKLNTTQKYSLKKKQSTQSYPMTQQRTSNLIELPSQPSLPRLRTLKEVRLESDFESTPSLLDRRIMVPRLSQAKSIDKSLIH